MDSSNLTTNDSNDYFGFVIPEPTPQYEIAAIMTFITIIGLLGNASILFIILRHSKMRTTTNLLVANLAVGDFTYFILHPPLHLYYFFTLDFPFGSALCKLTVFAQNASEGISVFTLTALSIERYYAIVRPMQLHTSRTPYRTIVITIVIWLLSLALASPTLEMAESISTWYQGKSMCQSLPTHMEKKAKIFKLFNFAINFAIPMLIITLFYSLTALQLMRSVRAPKSGVHAQCGEAQRKSRMKLALVVLSLVIGFAICWSPYYVYEIWFEFGLKKEFFSTPAMIKFAWWRFPIQYASSCINPIILYTISSSYRNYLYRHFCCCLQLLKKPQEPTSMTLPSGHTRLSEHTKTACASEASTTYAATTKV